MVAINTDANRAKYVAMRRRLKDFELTLTVDEGKALATRYAVNGLPHLVLIDKAGRVARVHVGYPENALQGFVDEINALLDE